MRPLRLLAALIALALPSVPAFAVQQVIPVHGVALGAGPKGTTIVRLDRVTNMLPPQTRAFRIEPALALPPGTGVDAFLDRSGQTWRLYDANVAGAFVPGLPDRGKVDGIDLGSTLPHTKLVDQRGRLVDLASDFRGKVLLLSFIFTRCPDKDECPTVSAKFAAMQKLLDPNRFHLIEISLDPVYDSPAVLSDYARQFSAGPSWSIVTGQPHEITHLLNSFGISSLRVSDENFVHNDKVFLTAPDGKVADIVQTVGFSPDGLAAQARHLNGMSSSTLGRLQLALVADVAALCGGSQFAGVVLLETMLFMFIAIVSFATLFYVARKIWRNA
jgi:protein SCO1/2